MVILSIPRNCKKLVLCKHSYIIVSGVRQSRGEEMKKVIGWILNRICVSLRQIPMFDRIGKVIVWIWRKYTGFNKYYW